MGEAGQPDAWVARKGLASRPAWQGSSAERNYFGLYGAMSGQQPSRQGTQCQRSKQRDAKPTSYPRFQR